MLVGFPSPFRTPSAETRSLPLVAAAMGAEETKEAEEEKLQQEWVPFGRYLVSPHRVENLGSSVARFQ